MATGHGEQISDVVAAVHGPRYRQVGWVRISTINGMPTFRADIRGVALPSEWQPVYVRKV